MGALPKNKITRVERGKRRRGNTPKLVAQVQHTSPQLHKRGLVAAVFRAVGLQTGAARVAKPAANTK